MSAEVKQELRERKREKELESILLPDAPPWKRACKNSPEMVPCRLVAGTPTTPPQPKPQPWQHQPVLPALPACLDDVTEDVASTAISSSSAVPTLLCNWTTGGLALGFKDWLLPPPRVAAPPCDALPLPPRRRVSATITSAEVEAAPDNLCASSSVVADSVPESRLSQTNSRRTADIQTDSGRNLVEDRLSDGDGEGAETENLDAGWLDINEAPAHLPDDIEMTYQEWLTRQDNDADRLMLDLIPTDSLTFDWNSSADSFQGQREIFTGKSGPTFSVPDDVRPIDVFLLFFTHEVFELLVSETNRHMFDILQPLQEHSRFHRAKETTKDEIALFIAILMFQGLLPLTVEKDYWQYNGYLTLSYFKQLMSYNRFVLLKRLLYFTDNAAPTETDDDVKLRKIEPLLKLLNSKFSKLYLPSRDIAIGESLLKWHGRLNFAQKIATKAAKVGVKTYELCESRTGYLWKFFIYTGKDQTHGQDLDAETDRHDEETDRHDEETDRHDEPVPSNATAQIVIDLVRPLLNRGHTLTMDNFYNSPLLARYLKKNRTDCLGTLRVNRQFVPESIKSISKSELRPGEIVQSYCRDLSVLLWRDQHLVAMLSTYHGGEIGGKKKFGTYRYKPQAVLDYNLSMGGVDKKDQLLSSHPIERSRNHHAWYKKVFRRLLNVTILNSYIIYKTRYPSVSQRQFRLRLANELVERTKKTIVVPPPVTDVEVYRVYQSAKHRRTVLRGNHFIGAGEHKRMRCVWCKNARTRYICKQCSVALCVNTCFEESHTKE